jgi:D-xylose transport system substrate-binding protein
VKRSILAALAAAGLMTSLACSKKDEGAPGATPAAGAEKKILIGLSLDTLKEERWQRDRDLFVKAAEARGAKVLVQAANSDDALQNSQAENLLTQGVQVLVVVPHNAKTTATIVESAHKMGVPVIAYDRLISDSDLDYYVTFDPVKVGELQADYALRNRPKGNYVLIGGAPTDNNAALARKGQMSILQPAIDKGDIKVVADQWAKDWQAVEALKIMENALTRNHNQVDAVVVSNDGTAAAPSRRWASRSCWARCSSPARTRTSRPASASSRAARP